MGWTERWQLFHVEDQVHGTHGDVGTWWCSQSRLWKRTSNELTEYIGNKIERVCEDAIQLVQTVLTQSYKDEFNIGNRCYNTPAQPGMVLMHPVKGKKLSIRRSDNVEIRHGKLKQWRDAWDLYYAQGMLDFCWSHLESGMNPTSISSASEEDRTQTMRTILRQDEVSLGTSYILKMHQQCIEALYRRQ